MQEEGTFDAPRFPVETNQATDAEKLMDVFCPTRHVIGRIGDKWTILIITALDLDGTLRFTQLRNRVGGITQKVLTTALRNLERDGLVHREAIPTVPVTVEYSLTDFGRSLATLATQIRDWSFANIDRMITANTDYDSRAVTQS
ncbi:helix-turn-helix domain-containing protein [Actinokineospora soli]